MRNLVLAAMFAATAAAPALAQDAAASFTGPRVEGIVGWDRVSNDGHDDGVTYGVGAGYDMRFGNLVAGVETELSDSNVKQCYGVSVGGNGVCASMGRDIYVGGRVGTVLGDRTLLYAKAGYTNARASLAVTTPNGTTRAHENLDGVRVGAGAEYALTSNAYLKAEYRYSNYQDGFSRNQLVGGFGFRF
ncbi:outer membrane protein [Sphingomonas quercus]|uniref:Porin family protein n=1 Tax=Sphingomonas quercus TaxID=2842451 RepID=A0ABS6BJ46_9SPHN|nr:porin family protein [Sphingomonas quercus]MBU3077244.1 porin family protein [Sphingomonas quercus]